MNRWSNPLVYRRELDLETKQKCRFCGRELSVTDEVIAHAYYGESHGWVHIHHVANAYVRIAPEEEVEL